MSDWSVITGMVRRRFSLVDTITFHHPARNVFAANSACSPRKSAVVSEVSTRQWLGAICVTSISISHLIPCLHIIVLIKRLSCAKPVLMGLLQVASAEIPHSWCESRTPGPSACGRGAQRPAATRGGLTGTDAPGTPPTRRRPGNAPVTGRAVSQASLSRLSCTVTIVMRPCSRVLPFSTTSTYRRSSLSAMK
jgi:hypothetical protein